MADILLAVCYALSLLILLVEAIIKKSDSTLLNLVREFISILKYVIKEIKDPSSLRRFLNATLCVALFIIITVCSDKALLATGVIALLWVLIAIFVLLGFFRVGDASKSITYTDSFDSGRGTSRWFRSLPPPHP